MAVGHFSTLFTASYELGTHAPLPGRGRTTSEASATPRSAPSIPARTNREPILSTFVRPAFLRAFSPNGTDRAPTTAAMAAPSCTRPRPPRTRTPRPSPASRTARNDSQSPGRP